ALEVAVDDSARVGVGDGVADADEGVEQVGEIEGASRADVALAVVVLDGLAEGAAADEAHGVVRLLVRVAGQLVDGNDPRVFELAGDAGLLEEALADHGAIAAVGAQLLEGNLAAQLGVMGQPDLADAAGGV